jgi:hypothetical protein
MSLEVCWDHLWTPSFGLSQFHGHGSWLVCEVALIPLTRWTLSQGLPGQRGQWAYGLSEAQVGLYNTNNGGSFGFVRIVPHPALDL